VKWIVFAVALAATIPLSQWLRRNPGQTSKVWILFGLLPFAFNQQITMMDWPAWPGHVKGLQITSLDLLALAIFIILPRARHSVPFRFVMGLYFLAVILSIFTAQVPMAAVFYAWQLARIFFIYVVVARACSDERVPTAILTGMAIGLCYQAVLAIWQRFGLGILQVSGSFGQQNLLGLASGLAIFPPFALLLAGKRGWQMIAAPVAGLIIAVLTTSRGAIGFTAIGLVLVFVMSSMRGWTARKASVFFAGVITIILLSPIAYNSFEQRFAAAPLAEGEQDERVVFERAAALILADHPFGVGANNYVVAGNSGGYFERAGVPWGGGQRNSLVHNAYWLAAAETGYLGAFALALLMFRTITMTFRCSWQNQKDPRGDLVLGLGVSLLILAGHSNYEWAFFMYPVQYILAMTVGLVAGMSEQLGYWRSAKRRVTQHDTQVAPENFAQIRGR
jgi:O-antigen ligase